MRKGICFLVFGLFVLQGCASIPGLHKAAREGDINKLTRLIDGGESVDLKDRWGNTPLHFASGHGRLEAAEALLDRGADPNALSYEGNAPIHYGCNIEVLNALLENGAESNISNKKKITPLHEAMRCRESGPMLARSLIESDADINEKNVIGLTPLHVAAGYSDPAAVELLIESGADVNAENIQGLTPRDMASVMGRQEIVEVLDKHGGVSKKYSAKDETKAQYVKGRYHGNSGIFPLKKTFETNSGFTAIRFKLGWNGSPGSLGWGFTYRGFVSVSGWFFAEPGHTYVIDAYGENSPVNAFGVARDQETDKVIGIF